MEQRYTSADTSIKCVNKVYTKEEFHPFSTVLDYGGGKYDVNINYMLTKQVFVYVYDKYNQTAEHNEEVINHCRKQPTDYIVCSNVLNVIFEEEIIDEILRDLNSLASDSTVIYFAIYEGNKSGIGAETSKGYQRNQRAKEYLPQISEYFEITKVRNGIITCKRKDFE